MSRAWPLLGLILVACPGGTSLLDPDAGNDFDAGDLSWLLDAGRFLDAGRPDGGVADAGVTDAGAGEDAGVRLLVFASRTKFDGALNAGPLDADARCTAIARSARLGGTWKAFLSTDGGWPTDRFTGDGPWGVGGPSNWTLVFPNRAAITNDTPAGLGFSEIGSTNEGKVWTGVPSGTTYIPTCQAFTSGANPEAGWAGNAGTHPEPQWATSVSASPCDSQFGLLCFQQSTLPALAPLGPPRIVFRTAELFSGDLKSEGAGADGLSGADRLCQSAAQRAGVSGTFHAWLSTSSTRAEQHVTGSGPWYQLTTDGGLLLTFPDRGSLADGPIVPLRQDEKGASQPYNWHWTGTVPLWRPGSLAYTCSDWTTTQSAGTYGRPNVVDDSWTDHSNDTCGIRNRLLCFQQ